MSSTSTPDLARATLGVPRLLTGHGPGYGEHLRALGPLPQRAGLVDEIARSGLTGRGGAAFPTSTKLAAMAPRGVVIGNGSEGEPLSAKDELLLHNRPHLVIDGLLATAHALAARRLHLVVGAASEEPVRRALRERGDADAIEVTVAPDRFVGGEASAVVDLLATGRGLPKDHAVRLTTRGLRGRSTLVQNVETLAHIGLIARVGGERWGAVGVPEDRGTRLFSISGDVAHPGVIEAPGGSSLRSLIAPSSPQPVSAVLVGGYHGAWVGRDALERTVGASSKHGAIPAGAGILVVLGDRSCGLRTAAEIAAYLAAESAGQCGPCVNGLPALADLVSRVADGDRDPRLPAQVERMAGLVEGRGACHHPDGTAKMVRSALVAFADDVAAHQHGFCRAAR
ncbi:MAG: NADH-quinone oxidoreductase subunit F [Acidobacteria bacterium]|nr:NADH-quinone oxidoreductase subunit F [Acidobacteriota bacterium]